MATYRAIHVGCGGHLVRSGGYSGYIDAVDTGHSIQIDYAPICAKCGYKIKSQHEIGQGEEVIDAEEK